MTDTNSHKRYSSYLIMILGGWNRCDIVRTLTPPTKHHKCFFLSPASPLPSLVYPLCPSPCPASASPNICLYLDTPCPSHFISLQGVFLWRSNALLNTYPEAPLLLLAPKGSCHLQSITRTLSQDTGSPNCSSFLGNLCCPHPGFSFRWPVTLCTACMIDLVSLHMCPCMFSGHGHCLPTRLILTYVPALIMEHCSSSSAFPPGTCLLPPHL